MSINRNVIAKLMIYTSHYKGCSFRKSFANRLGLNKEVLANMLTLHLLHTKENKGFKRPYFTLGKNA